MENTCYKGTIKYLLNLVLADTACSLLLITALSTLLCCAREPAISVSQTLLLSVFLVILLKVEVAVGEWNIGRRQSQSIFFFFFFFTIYSLRQWCSHSRDFIYENAETETQVFSLQILQCFPNIPCIDFL